MSVVGDRQLRKKLIHIIASNPGIHLSSIADRLDVQLDHVERQLSLLEHSGRIKIQIDEGLRGYYLHQPRKHTRKGRTEETRQKIYECIAANPGYHLAKIAEVLGMSIQLVNYHVLKMQKNQQIVGVEDEHGYYTRYYIAESGVSSQDKRLLEMLRKPIPSEIVLLLLKYKNLQHKELRKRLRLYSSKLTYHLNNLLRYDIIAVTPYGEEKGYSLKDPSTIKRLIKEYNLSLEAEVAVEEFTSIWEDLHYE